MRSRKGYVFSWDASIAAILVVGILISSTYYVSKAEGGFWYELQMVNVGYDIVTMLDRDGTLETIDVKTINYELNRSLPASYAMMLRIEGESCGTIELGDTLIPSDRFIGNGDRIFVISRDDGAEYAVVRFWIWLREMN